MDEKSTSYSDMKIGKKWRSNKQTADVGVGKVIWVYKENLEKTV